MHFFRAGSRRAVTRASETSLIEESQRQSSDTEAALSDFEITFARNPDELELPIRMLDDVPEAELGLVDIKDELCICDGTLSDMISLERRYRRARTRILKPGTIRPLRVFRNISLSQFLDHNSPCHVCQPIRWHLREKLGKDTLIDDLDKALERPIAVAASSPSYYVELNFRLLSVKTDAQSAGETPDESSAPGIVTERLLALQFFPYKASAHSRVPLVIGHIQPDVDGRRAVPCMQRWLDECRASHDCVPSFAPPPTRLIDLGTLAEPVFRLQLTADVREARVDHVALSYSWGGYKGFVLTVDHLAKLQQGLAEADLPKTFSDAARLTRGLGMRYIWIDALCIIQDSVDDWQRESKKMHEVYGNAVLTLSAANSSSTVEGFLKSREPQTTTKSYLGTVSHEDDEYHVYLGRYQQNLVTQLRDLRNGPLHEEPLFSRGWTVQERQLSKRIVHFTKHRLIWKCQRVTLFEDGEAGDVDEDPEPLGGEQADRFWFDIIKEFSSCALTNPSDRLPAVAGLASALSSMKGDTYLAGHWQDNLFRSLMWQGNELGRNEEHAAPSWSWASSKGSVRFPHDRVGESPEHNYAARLLSVSHNEGLVKLKVNVASADIELRWSRAPLDDSSAHAMLTRSRLPHLSLLSEYTVLDAEMHSLESLSDLLPGQTRKTVAKRCKLAWIFSDVQYPELLSCLLLELVDRERQEYRRIGLSRIQSVTPMQRRTFFLTRKDIVLV